MEPFKTFVIGNKTDCRFYFSDRYYNLNYSSSDTSSMAFRVAYDVATRSKNNKELCASVGSMLCDVSYGFKVSVVEALDGIGVKPCFVRLPSEAHKHNIEQDKVPEMDSPTISVIFGYCIILLFTDTNNACYSTYMSECFRELQRRAGCDPAGTKLHIPFNFREANAIRAMLGASLSLRQTLIRFLIGTTNRVVTGALGPVCQYLCSILSWSGMHELVLMKEVLVKPQSPVLIEPCVSREAGNLFEAWEAIGSSSVPQFFKHMASNEEQLKVEHSRFPTLIAVAQKLDKEYNGSNFANSAVNSISEFNPKEFALP
ncbi:hypothetical protein SESBI_13985 [Sesbania bispinosa]|nr:hypothetical protein SESBI_13985 [Sesbania bispinosa]